MNYNARKFSQKSYNDNDDYAKKKILNYLISRGHELISDEENYNHDIVTKKNNELYYFEVEVKRNYPFTNQRDYKFSTVSFLGRKSRLHNIKPYYYFILCYETDSVVFCHSSKIFKDGYKEKLTLKSYERKGNDEMYRVPINECGFFNLK